MPFESQIELIAQHLETQSFNNSITDETIWNELKLSKSKFYRLKPKAIEIFQEKIKQRQLAIEKAKEQEISKAVKSGLKTKHERLLILQKQVDEIILDLEAEEISVTEKAYLRRVLKDIQSEISKIEGDYAPALVSTTITVITEE